MRAALPGLLLAGAGASAGLAGWFESAGPAGAAAEGASMATASLGGIVGQAVAYGCLAAAVTGAAGVVLKARAVFGMSKSAGPDVAASGKDDQIRARLEAQRFQIALFGDFLVNLFVLGGGLFAVRSLASASPTTTQTDVMMGFGLAFATIALLHQVGAALVLSSLLRQRARMQPSPVAPSSPAGPETAGSELSGSELTSWAASAPGGRTIHAHR
jgi:hypothetical protein